MANKGNPFVRKYSFGTTYEMVFQEYFDLETEEQVRLDSEEENTKPLYVVPFEEIYHFWRHT